MPGWEPLEQPSRSMLAALRRAGVRTTGTARTRRESRRLLVLRAAGVRVAVTGAGPSVFRFKAAEDALGRFDPQALEGITVDAAGLNTDIHASAEYRAHAVAVLAKRTVAKALEQ